MADYSLELIGGISVHDRTKRLVAIMEQHQLTVGDVAGVLNVAEATVRIWRCKHPARVIPDRALQLLEVMAQARTAAA